MFFLLFVVVVFLQHYVVCVCVYRVYLVSIKLHSADKKNHSNNTIKHHHHGERFYGMNMYVVRMCGLSRCAFDKQYVIDFYYTFNGIISMLLSAQYYGTELLLFLSQRIEYLADRFCQISHRKAKITIHALTHFSCFHRNS